MAPEINGNQGHQSSTHYQQTRQTARPWPTIDMHPHRDLRHDMAVKYVQHIDASRRVANIPPLGNGARRLIYSAYLDGFDDGLERQRLGELLAENTELHAQVLGL